MKLFYDFHIHTALSPCADNDMTPNNVVNMALIKELDCIAVTDHNTCKNVKACLDVAKETGLLVLPGMELETSEEIHVVCLLPDLDAMYSFDSYVESRLNKIKNRPDIFGRQYILDADDEIVSEYESLLITSTTIDFDTIFSEIKNFGGIAIPAHVDRSSNSVLANLGAIPDNLDIPCIEISKKHQIESYVEENKDKFLRNYMYIKDSDAHYLPDISEREQYLEFDKKPEIKDIIERLRAYGMDRR